MKLKHQPGARFGRLVIVSRDGREITCRCDCGSTTTVRVANLISGHTVSCGCVRDETTAARSTTHGHASRGRHSGAYRSWADMLKRCTNPRSKSWPDYGGRGIKVYERWLDFRNFFADMGDRPPSHSIERIDTNGNYEPGNVKWATRQEQARNTRRNHLVTFGGKTQTVAAWAAALGINHASLLRRLRNWPIEQALTRGRRK